VIIVRLGFADEVARTEMAYATGVCDNRGC
jgi:hypothetical protein